MANLGTKFGTESTRFQEEGEIYYCIASILKHAPFLNRIYVVTDDQDPKFLQKFHYEGICSSDKITVVYHKEIFRDNYQHYPTFNSLSIESMLWNIEGLSDFFIYFNDDVFLLKDISEKDFITQTRKLLLRGEFLCHPKRKSSWGLKSALNKLRGRSTIDTFGINQSNAAKLIGMEHYFRVAHYPHIIRSKTLKDFFDENDEVLNHQLQFKFRSNEQCFPVSIANHLEIRRNQAELLPLEKSCYIKPNTVSERRLETIWANDVRFGCIQSLDQFSPKWRAKTHEMMRRKFSGYLPEVLSDTRVCSAN